MGRQYKEAEYYEREYQKEKQHREFLERKLKSNRGKILLGVLMILLGILLLYDLASFHLLIANILYAPACMILGIRWIWLGVINFGTENTEEFARKLGIITIREEIDRTSAKMEDLLRRAQKERKRSQEVYDELMGAEKSDKAQSDQAKSAKTKKDGAENDRAKSAGAKNAQEEEDMSWLYGTAVPPKDQQE